MERKRSRKIVVNNKKAGYEYFLGKKFEAGVVLTGAEVKGARTKGGSFTSPFVKVACGEAWIFGLGIPTYDHTGAFIPAPDRARKLLLHKSEIRELNEFVKTGVGRSIIPTSVYFDENGRAKVEICLATGKKLYDKRESEKQRDANRQIERGGW